MYTLGVSADRRYHLQSEEANRAVDALLEQLRVPAGQWRLYSDMLTTVLKLYEDGAGVVDLKITSAALKEMLDDLSSAERRDDGRIEDAAREALRRVVRAHLGKKPLTDVHIVRI